MKRNKFSLSHYKLLTGNMGELLPLTWYEVLPGDSIQHKVSLLLRATPILAPLMHPCKIRIHSFYVPYRLLQDDWEDYITGGQDGNDTTDRPYIAFTNPSEGSLADYMGVPTGTYSANLNAMPFRAYASIYNEHYRDQDLVTELTLNTGNGADATTNTSIQKVSFEKDFYSTLRLTEQRGSDVNIPLAGTAPVLGIGVDDQNYSSGPKTVYETGKSASSSYADYRGGGNVSFEESTTNAGYPNIYAQLADATGVSVSDLRLYLALQRYKENMQMGGARYVEYLAHRWGVKSSDARLNIPEYISGGRQTVQFSEILATGGADDGSNSPIGSMRGHGIAAMRTRPHRRFFEEHGLVMTLLSIVPKAIYADGIFRHWLREDKEDYFTKELELVGDRAVENQEIYAEHTTPAGTFGYGQRYDEYRTGPPSMIHGEFRGTLNYWHYARMFAADPSLNQTFIECNPTKRQYADNTNDSFYMMVNHSIQARRQINKFPSKRIV